MTHRLLSVTTSADVCFRGSDGGDRIVHNGVAFFLEQAFDNHIFRRHNVAFTPRDQGSFELLNIYFSLML